MTGASQSDNILWHGEFGRLPISERMDGAVENRRSVYELHATLLLILGLDFEALTYRFNGRDMRLTDVHGKVIVEVLA